MTGRQMTATRDSDAGTRCEAWLLVREDVRAVRHRPSISPDNLSSGVYTGRRAARWAGACGVRSRNLENAEGRGGGEQRMNSRGAILTTGAVMVTAGVLIELAGYIGDHTTTGETSYPPQQRADGARISNHALPAAPVTATRIAEATADDPYLAVHYLYRAIANGSATGCAVFSPTAAMQFATHFDASDCSTATTRLSEKVTNPINYAQTSIRSPDIYLDDTMTISSCEIRPEGGPPLGRFTLRRTEQSKWYISGHETEEC
jgi:hypothetical protein